MLDSGHYCSVSADRLITVYQWWTPAYYNIPFVDIQAYYSICTSCEHRQYTSGGHGLITLNEWCTQVYYSTPGEDTWGVAKRCRQSWLTNRALVYEPKYGGMGGGVRGLSQ
jgi:hypothetical protein